MAFYKSLISQITLYKYRYFLGYGIIVALILISLMLDINTIPNGISRAEMNSAITSMNLNPKDSLGWIINAPHHVIQRIAIEMFGLSRITLLAPSLFFAIFTIILFNLTIRRWFSGGVAVISTILASTSTSFMLLTRSGTPDVMLPFWTVLFIYAGVGFLINHEKGFFWKILIVLSSIGLIYTPYGIYTLVACVIGGITHPHVRSRLRHIRPVRVMVLALLGLIGIIPLIIYTIQQPMQFITLIGLDQLPNSMDQLRANLANIASFYLDFTNSRVVDLYITPIFNITSVALMLFGIFRLAQKHHTARAYVMLSWAGVTILVILLLNQSPQIAYMPAMFLLAFGMTTLIEEWYKLFPRNPYARLAGMIPLGILLFGIAGSNLAHYFNSFRYMPSPAYSASLSAVKQAVRLEGNRSVTVVTDTASKQFYEILKNDYSNLSVTDQLPEKISQPTLVLPSASNGYDEKSPSRIFVTWTKDHNVVLRVYRP
ncbi:hypothetical protein EOM57_01980 [Candidatus Saccharibacteria bacterium]|nr:hypothetical protein [Candidatus Saccharibacteria bacterium]